MTGKRNLLIAGAVLLGALLLWGAIRRAKTEADDGHDSLSGDPVAAVVRVERRNLGTPLTLAGAFKPFQDVENHAKVAGLIKAL